ADVPRGGGKVVDGGEGDHAHPSRGGGLSGRIDGLQFELAVLVDLDLDGARIEGQVIDVDETFGRVPQHEVCSAFDPGPDQRDAGGLARVRADDFGRGGEAPDHRRLEDR